MMTAVRDPKPGLLPRSWGLDLSARVATPRLESLRPRLPGPALPAWSLVEFLLLCASHSPGRLQPWQLRVGGEGCTSHRAPPPACSNWDMCASRLALPSAPHRTFT